jgi:2',3'-cyclic-nucleotide 2'-phosphodiesterase (5'-nucleotidase family)
VNNSVDALRAQHPGLNKIVLLSHLQQFQNEVTLAPLLRGVDIIVAAGSNTITADAGDRLRSGDVSRAAAVATSTESTPILIVSTDGNYRYVGRLVVTFNDAGVLDPASVLPADSGAYATTDAIVTSVWNTFKPGQDPFGPGTKGAAVRFVTDAVQQVITVKDSTIFGRTQVFIEGRRNELRTEETNLGNLTADANLAKLIALDESTVPLAPPPSSPRASASAP